MSVALANVFRTGVFASMNNKKGHNMHRADHIARQAAADCQYVSLVKSGVEAAKETQVGSRYASVLTGAVQKTQTSSKLFDLGCKVVKWAGELVNPLLVVASGFRIAASKDKKSAAIEEAGAMLGMFAVEGAIKKSLGLTGKAPTYKNNKILSSLAQKGKNFIASNKYLNKLPQNKVTNLIKGGIFILGSILAFDGGQRIGRYIADHTTAKKYEKKHPVKNALGTVLA